MSSVTFDTLPFITELRDARFNNKQAETMLSTIKTYNEVGLVTNADLARGLRDLEYRLIIKFGALLVTAQIAAVGILTALIKLL